MWMVTELEPLRVCTWIAAKPGLLFQVMPRIDDAGIDVRTTLECTVTGSLAWMMASIAGPRIQFLLS